MFLILYPLQEVSTTRIAIMPTALRSVVDKMIAKRNQGKLLIAQDDGLIFCLLRKNGRVWRPRVLLLVGPYVRSICKKQWDEILS